MRRGCRRGEARPEGGKRTDDSKKSRARGDEKEGKVFLDEVVIVSVDFVHFLCEEIDRIAQQSSNPSESLSEL